MLCPVSKSVSMEATTNNSTNISFAVNEYQKSSGNLAHIHGLFGVYRDELSDDEGDKNRPTTKLNDYITKCQACGVGDLVQMDRVKKGQDEGLLADLEDWTHLSTVGKKGFVS